MCVCERVTRGERTRERGYDQERPRAELWPIIKPHVLISHGLTQAFRLAFIQGG